MSTEGPLPSWLRPASQAAAMAYGIGVRVRGAMLARTPAVHAPVPVVSVGNLTAGGTGKTPMVRWVVGQALAAGRHPLIALRGYRARDGRSDEAEEYRALLPGVPIALGPDRRTTIAAACAADARIDCAVLDDAFQHRRLARALDIVLVDATRPALGGALLPAGWLREPSEALRRADLVVVTRAARAEDPALTALVARFHGAPPAAWTQHAWTHLEERGARQARLPVESLRGRRVLACAAIGHPEAFVADAQSHGAELVGARLFPDHAPFDAARVDALAAQAKELGAALLVTGKDWTKIEPALAAAGADARAATWLIAGLSIRFLAGEAEVAARVRAALERPRR